MAHTFKKGDRVKRSRGSSYAGMNVGDEGTITEVFGNGELKMKEWSQDHRYDGDNYELVEVKRPEIINTYQIY